MNSMDDSSEHEKDRYPAWFLGQLQDLRSEGHLVDVTLCAEGTEIPCHRVVLSACTDYFRAMFCSGHSEVKKDKIEIGGVSAEVLQQLVDFAYTSKVMITADNIQPLFEAANMLQVEEVENRCAAFLGDCLSPETCLGTWVLAAKVSHTRLCAKARSYALKNFEEVSKADEFLELPFDFLKMYISDSGLHTKKEEQVLEVIMLWARHDLQERQRHLKELMECVHFSHMDQNCLQTIIETDKVFAGIPGMKELIKGVSRHAKPRQILQEEILVFGGRSEISQEDRNHNLYRLDLNCDCIDTMALPRAIQNTEGSAVCVVSNDVIVTGGDKLRHRAWRYKPSLNSWTKMGSLRSGRTRHGMTVLQEQVYVIGGQNSIDHTMISSVEVYNELTNSWTETAPLQQAVRNFGVATCCDKVYVFGGKVHNNDTDVLQCYETTQNAWTLAAPLPNPACSMTACTVSSKIYLVGGHLRRVLCYDPEKNCYEELAARLGQWHQSSATVCGSEIYITGGFWYNFDFYRGIKYKSKETPGALATVQCYNASNDTMMRVNNLSFKVCGHHTVTISKQ